MSMNACKRVVVFSLASVVAVGCSSATDQSTAPPPPPPNPTVFSVTISDVQTRVTTPGSFRLTVNANKPVTRVEITNADGTVFGYLPTALPYILGVPVDAAKNGTQSFTGKAFADNGETAEIHTVSVVVDIRWDFIHKIDDLRSYGAAVIARDAMNAMYLAGTTDQHDVFLIKHDADGNRTWIRNFGGPDRETAGSIGVDVSGRIFIAGFISRSIGNDCFLIIFDAAGGVIRVQQIAGDLIDHSGGCIASADGSGNFYVTGSTLEPTDGHQFLIKYDPDGNTLWVRKFGGERFPSSVFPNDGVTSVLAEASGEVYVAGATGLSFDGNPNRGSRDAFLLKFDASGNRLWARQYGTAGLATFAYALALGPGGDVYIAGQSLNPATYDTYYSTGNVLLLRYGSDGTRRWVKTFDGGHADSGWGVAADDRGIYLVGSTVGGYGPGTHDITEPSQGLADIFLAKLSFDGNLLSVRLLGYQEEDFAGGVVLGGNGAIYIGGATVPDPRSAIYIPLLARHPDVP